MAGRWQQSKLSGTMHGPVQGSPYANQKQDWCHSADEMCSAAKIENSVQWELSRQPATAPAPHLVHFCRYSAQVIFCMPAAANNTTKIGPSLSLFSFRPGCQNYMQHLDRFISNVRPDYWRIVVGSPIRQCLTILFSPPNSLWCPPTWQPGSRIHGKDSRAHLQGFWTRPGDLDGFEASYGTACAGKGCSPARPLDPSWVGWGAISALLQLGFDRQARAQCRLPPPAGPDSRKLLVFGEGGGGHIRMKNTKTSRAPRPFAKRISHHVCSPRAFPAFSWDSLCFRGRSSMMSIS